MSKIGVETFNSRIRNILDIHRKAGDLTNSEAIGILEMIKLDTKKLPRMMMKSTRAPTMCEWGNTTKIKLMKLQRGSMYADVDACIAQIVQALNNAGIETIASCCGHNRINGNIVLGDGRVLEIHPDFEKWNKEQQLTD